MKKLFKKIIILCLGACFKRLRRRNPGLRVVAVVGSIGKTTTKMAIAHVLKQKYKVASFEGGYNDPTSVITGTLGLSQPPLFSPIGWIKTITEFWKLAGSKLDYEVLVLEFGIDHPGEMAGFKNFTPDYLVVTAITPEHMQNFESLDQVASEELSLANKAKYVVVNVDDVDPKYLEENLKNPDAVQEYGFTSKNGLKIAKP